MTRLALENAELKNDRKGQQELQMRIAALEQEGTELKRELAKARRLVTELESHLEHEQRNRMSAEAQREEFRARLRGRRSVFE